MLSIYGEVAILVLVDNPFGVDIPPADTVCLCRQVAILVLVDNPFGGLYESCNIVKLVVAILVLVDNPFGDGNRLNLMEHIVESQSLF